MGRKISKLSPRASTYCLKKGGGKGKSVGGERLTPCLPPHMGFSLNCMQMMHQIEISLTACY